MFPLIQPWFFLQTNFDFVNYPFLAEFFLSFKMHYCLKLTIEKVFHQLSFFVNLWGFEGCLFGQFVTIPAIDFALLTYKRRFNPS